ncbi:MAG: NosD domain-containing protein, partial [Actinomycetota bacterium]
RLSASAVGNTIGQAGAGNVLSGNTSDGIETTVVGAGNTIQGNTIGLGPDGDTVVANGRHGVVIYQSDNNLIGGTGSGAGNLISGNGQRGVVIDGDGTALAANNQIVGNRIGTDTTGALDRGNGDEGVLVMRGAVTTVIGGSTAAHGNVISGNDGAAGVLVTDAATADTSIQHNQIGTDEAGTAAVANTSIGVWIEGAATTDVLDNLIAGNSADGILIDSAAPDTELYRNLIGLDAAGTAALANGGDGVEVATGASGTIIGSAGNGNVIGTNTGHGIRLDGAAGTVIQANHIGTDAGATIDLGNVGDGIALTGSASTGTTIGGTGAGDGNAIANNVDGVSLAAGTGSGHAIVGNDIDANTGFGIDLDGDGITANDAGDADTGANDLLNFPVIDNVQRVAGDLVVDVTIDVAAGDHRIELFANTVLDPSGHGEGSTFLGGATVTHTGSGPETFSVTVASGPTLLTATTTEDLGGGSFGSTSEFSAGELSPDLVIVNSTGDGPDASVGDGACDTGGTNADGAPECTLRAAIEEANDASNPIDTIWFTVPATDSGHAAGVWTLSPASALPTIGDTTTINATTQSGWTPTTVAAPAGLDGTPAILLDGSSAGATSGLVVGADSVVIDGLVIGGFTNHGIEITGDDATVTGSFIGTDASGTTALANGRDGINVT